MLQVEASLLPFQDNMPAFDFRLENVLSISTSGHKFGESICGTGWVVFRQREDLTEHIAISVSYLGGTLRLDHAELLSSGLRMLCAVVQAVALGQRRLP